MSRIRAASIIAVVALVASCTGDTAPTTTQVFTGTSSTTISTVVTTTIPDLSGELENAHERIDELEAEVEALSSDLEEERQLREEAEDALAEAQAEIDGLVLAYDEEIQQLLVNGVSAIVETGCSAVDGEMSGSEIVSLVDDLIANWAAQPGLPTGAAEELDRGSIEEQVAACAAEAAEEARQAELRAPKGDGFYTVGEEIAPGTWESQGSGDGCYWARLDGDQGILDNHFGTAGGRVTIRSSDVEVEFNGCGQWEFQG